MTSRQQWQTRGHVAVFVKCLHLLDLRSLEDWPKITEQSFSSKSNLQQRLKCAEWSLFRLFDRYNHALCQEKLSPFFPPSTHLQSLNLRAALFRQLTDLKKQGILGQHVQLRRTMLDECKGEKFEEVLAAFAMIVLRETLEAVGGLASDGIVQQNRLPILLAYRKSLQKKLRERKVVTKETIEMRSALSTLSHTLDLEERKVRSLSIPIAKEKEQMLEGLFRANWLGDGLWVDVVLNGRSESRVTPDRNTVNENMIFARRSSTTLTQKLHDRIQHHQQRLEQWSRAYTGLAQTQAVGNAPRNQKIASEPTQPFFNRHQNLRPVVSPEITIQTHSEYQRLFLALESGISVDSRPRNSDLVSEAPTSAITEAKDMSRIDKSLPRRSQNIAEAKSTEVLVHGTSFTPVEVTDETSTTGDSQETYRPHPSVETTMNIITEQQDRPSKTNNLTERTRASLIRFEYDSGFSEEKVENVSNDEAVHPLEKSTAGAEYTNPRLSLAERTRKSMLSWSDPPPPGSKSEFNKSGLENPQFSVNQFETPVRLRTSLQLGWTSESGRSTPREKLFDEDADVTSVFKSRPRIATSPALSPQQNDVLEDSILG